MTPLRRSRMTVVGIILIGSCITFTAVLLALKDNIELFYLPAQIVAGEAPVGQTVRAGGMVQVGSIEHASEGLKVSFVLTDLEGASFPVTYEGLLPSLFVEGQGTVVTGKLQEGGVFHASTVLAKHDENYMPPELDDLAPHS